MCCAERTLARADRRLRLTPPFGLGNPTCCWMRTIVVRWKIGKSNWTSTRPCRWRAQRRKRTGTAFPGAVSGTSFRRGLPGSGLGRSPARGNPAGQRACARVPSAIRRDVERAVGASRLRRHQLHLMLRAIGPRWASRYSLACNPDLSLDLLERVAANGLRRPLFVGVVHPDPPFIGNEAEINEDRFDLILDTPDTRHQLHDRHVGDRRSPFPAGFDGSGQGHRKIAPRLRNVRSLAQMRKKLYLKEIPFGNGFDEVDRQLLPVLRNVQGISQNKVMVAAFLHAILMNRTLDDFMHALRRMGLDRPTGLRERVRRRLILRVLAV